MQGIDLSKVVTINRKGNRQGEFANIVEQRPEEQAPVMDTFLAFICYNIYKFREQSINGWVSSFSMASPMGVYVQFVFCLRTVSAAGKFWRILKIK